MGKGEISLASGRMINVQSIVDGIVPGLDQRLLDAASSRPLRDSWPSGFPVPAKMPHNR